MAELTKFNLEGTMYYIDFRLSELRECANVHNVISFSQLDEETKGQIRMARALKSLLAYNKDLDD